MVCGERKDPFDRNPQLFIYRLFLGTVSEINEIVPYQLFLRKKENKYEMKKKTKNDEGSALFIICSDRDKFKCNRIKGQ